MHGSSPVLWYCVVQNSCFYPYRMTDIVRNNLNPLLPLLEQVGRPVICVLFEPSTMRVFCIVDVKSKHVNLSCSFAFKCITWIHNNVSSNFGTSVSYVQWATESENEGSIYIWDLLHEAFSASRAYYYLNNSKGVIALNERLVTSPNWIRGSACWT